jgi:uncharacterized protein
VFLDANVLFGASYRENPGLKPLWSISGVVLLASTYVVDKARRNAIDERQTVRLDQLVASLEIVTTHFDPLKSRLAAVILPVKDQPVLIDALDARATHLLSGDRNHFGRYDGRELKGIWIMKPNDYLADKLRRI